MLLNVSFTLEIKTRLQLNISSAAVLEQVRKSYVADDSDVHARKRP